MKIGGAGDDIFALTSTTVGQSHCDHLRRHCNFCKNRHPPPSIPRNLHANQEDTPAVILYNSWLHLERGHFLLDFLVLSPQKDLEPLDDWWSLLRR